MDRAWTVRSMVLRHMQKCYEHMGSKHTWVAEQTNTVREHCRERGKQKCLPFFLTEGLYKKIKIFFGARGIVNKNCSC